MFPELLADLINDMWDKFTEDEVNQMVEAVGKKTAKDIILSAYKVQKGISFFDKTRLAKAFVNKAHIQEVKEVSMKAIDEQLKKFGIRVGMRKRARFDLNAQSNNVWWRKQQTTHPYSWRYLIDEKHSDRCIYRMRVRWKNNDGTSNIDICFLHHVRKREVIAWPSKPQKIKKGMLPGTPLPSEPYLFHEVPNAIVCVMSLIPLTYLTKNNYFAGAYNFFWYSWLMKDAPRSYLKGFRFMTSKVKKGIIKYINKINKGEA